MAKKISPRLKRALEVFEIGELDLIVNRKRRDDFEALRGLITMEADPEYRQRAIYALGRWGDTDVVPELIAILPRLDESERITALDALGRLNTRESRNAVQTCAQDSSPDVRKFVIAALRRFGGADADSTLRKIAKEDREGWIRSLAEQALESNK